jgi:Pyruvate/2-oxoacid:ferredoxin oxidoreductase gamma subunit
MLTKLLSKSICVLISGRAGTGKTTSAQSLFNHFSRLGYNCMVAPFATGVKNTARFMGWDGEKNELGRELLISIGMGGRKYNKDLWAKWIFNKIERSEAYPFDVVIMDDWRFINEGDFAKKQLLYKTFTMRISAPNREILLGTKFYTDPSETGLPFEQNYYDYYVDNTGSLVNLDRVMQDIAEDMLEKTYYKKE